MGTVRYLIMHGHSEQSSLIDQVLQQKSHGLSNPVSDEISSKQHILRVIFLNCTQRLRRHLIPSAVCRWLPMLRLSRPYSLWLIPPPFRQPSTSLPKIDHSPDRLSRRRPVSFSIYVTAW